MQNPATKLPNSSAQSSWDEYVWLAAAENLVADVPGNIIRSYSSCIPKPSSSGSLSSLLSSLLLSIAFPALDLSAWLMLLPPLPCLDACTMPRLLAAWWMAFSMPPPPRCRGACLGDWSHRRHLPAAGSFPTADSRMPPRPSRAWYGRPCTALTSSTTSPHRKTRLRRPRGSLPGPSHPPQPSPLPGGAGLSDALPRGEFSPGCLRAFCLHRTASHRRTAIRHRTSGAPHARSQGRAKLRSYCGGHFSFT